MCRQRRRIWLSILSIVFICFTLCLADDDSNDPGFEHNPILLKQPSFARSLLVQVLFDGIIIALTSVLFFHLLFTGQYHWPLAAINYVLQLSGVICLLVSCIATVGIVLRQAFDDSQQWPYMFTYINIPVPPTQMNASGNNTVGVELAWTTAELAGWYIMDATTSAFVQITHIQFLTLLYPSHLEARLILFLLGPLAVTSAAMQLLPIHQSQTVLDYADTVRNTCNAALSLLFTAAVCLWGFVVNRKGAWRTDGGTAAFGAGAITLALGATVLNFIYIHTRDDYPWLRHFIWVVILWQSFLGWWWWVGSGCGVGEVEELIRREERRDRRRKARAERRSMRKEKAQALWRNASESLGFARRGSNNGDAIEMSLIGQDGDQDGATPAGHHASGSVAGSDNATTTSGTESGILARLRTSSPMLAFSHFYHLLRRAHLAAVHSQAIDRVRRRREVYAGETGAGAAAGGSDVDPGVVGWGLGSFGLRERERRAMNQAGNDDMDDLVAHERGEDEDESENVGERNATERPGRVVNNKPPVFPPRERPGSIWWWGPLRRWRLQDSTTY